MFVMLRCCAKITKGVFTRCIWNCVFMGVNRILNILRNSSNSKANTRVVLTQEVHSIVLVTKMMEKGSEGGEKNGCCVTENLGYSSSQLASTLRNGDQGFRNIFHSHL